MKKRLKALISMITLATVAFSTSVSAITLEDKEAKAGISNQKRSIGYYADWAIYQGQGFCFPKQVPAEHLTHLNVAFSGVKRDGTLLMLDPDANFGHPLGHTEVSYGDPSGGIVNELQNIRQQNPNLKLGFSVGGWSLSGTFTWVARDAGKRKVFAKEVAELLEYTNFDFIDIDWEYPADVRPPDNEDLKNDEGNPDAIPEDKENYVLLLQEVRNELDKLEEKTGKDYEISIAINMSHYKTEIGIDVPKIFNIIDFANVMTYDANGAWSPISGHQTALYDNPNDPWAGKGFSVDSSIKNFLKLGAPSNKLVVGAAFYTRGWERVANNGPDPSLPGLYGTATAVNKDIDLAPSYGAKNETPIVRGDGGRHAGNWSWKNRDKLHATYPGLKEYWDDTAKAPYLYSEASGAFFTYDNKRSIAEKTKYVNEHNLGGIITWMVSNDKVTETGKNDDLTKAIYEGLFGNTKLPEHELTYPILDINAKVNVVEQDWGAVPAVLTIDIANNMKLISTGGLMPKTAEASFKTIKFPKVYVKTKNGVKLSGGDYPLSTIPFVDGYYVLDAGATMERYIKPGASLILTARLDKGVSLEEGIEEIFITQRMHRQASEFGKQYLYKYEAPTPVKEDVNKDGKVDVTDLSLVAAKYNVKSTDAAYDAACDINDSKVIDLFDLVMVAKKIGATTPDNPEEPDIELATPWDGNGVAYKLGDKVSFNGKNYECTFGHQSQPGWSPTAAPTLWKIVK